MLFYSYLHMIYFKEVRYLPLPTSISYQKTKPQQGTHKTLGGSFKYPPPPSPFKRKISDHQDEKASTMMSANTLLPTPATLPHVSPFAKKRRVADSIMNTSFPTMPDLEKCEDTSCDMAHQKSAACIDLTSSTDVNEGVDEEMSIAQVLASLGGHQSNFAVSNI